MKSNLSKRKTLRESLKKIIAFEQKWKCNYCEQMLPSTYEIDHIIPHAISFDDNRSNLCALCNNCHSKKSQREYHRIMFCRRKRSNCNQNICFYCLELFDDSHTCDKKFKDISYPHHDPRLRSANKEQISNLDKFIHLDFEKLNITSESGDSRRSAATIRADLTELTITISRSSIICRDSEMSKQIQLNKNTHLTPMNLVVLIAKNNIELDSYDKIKIILDIPHDKTNCDGTKACIKYLEEVLPSVFENHCLKSPTFTYSSYF